MAFLVATCPHCRSEKMTFEVFGMKPLWHAGIPATVMVSATCGKCIMPIVSEYRWHDLNGSFADFVRFTNAVFEQSRIIDRPELIRNKFWPEAEAARIPEALPDAVTRAFTQAERNYAMPDCEEAAAMLYRRALELALEHVGGQPVPNLKKRITEMVASHALPAIIGDWAGEVRIIGNSGAHDIEGVSRHDVEAARDFVDLTLRYLITLPALVQQRRDAL